MGKKISQRVIDTFRRKIIEKRNILTTENTPESVAIYNRMIQDLEKRANDIFKNKEIKNHLRFFAGLSFYYLTPIEIKNKLDICDSDFNILQEILQIITEVKNAEINSRKEASKEELERLEDLEVKLTNYNALAELGQIDDEFVEELKALLG